MEPYGMYGLAVARYSRSSLLLRGLPVLKGEVMIPLTIKDRQRANPVAFVATPAAAIAVAPSCSTMIMN